MASRGPYYNDREQKPSTATPTHTRFDDDDNLPDVAPAFAGSNAGQKTREKARRAMMDREIRAASDEEDWFSNHRSPASTPNGRGRGMGIRGRGGRMAGTPRNRPWDSDSRPTQGRNDPARGMPFGHSHLMASAPASARGNRLSFQDIASGTAGSDSPTASKGKGKKGGNPARNLLERAIKGSHQGQQSPADSKKASKQSKANKPKKTDKSNKSSKSPAEPRSNTASPAPSQTESTNKRRRKKNRDDEADLESTWWSSGKAGGNVSNWGKDMPSSSTGPKGKKAAVKGNRGQQYMGGY
jgi:protein AIR1/2